MFTPMQPYTFVNGQNLHDAGKYFVKNAQNRDLLNLVIRDQLENREYLAKVRYYTHNGSNKFGLNFYVPPALPRPIFITNPPVSNTSVQVNTQSCTDKAAGGRKAIQDFINDTQENFKKSMPTPDEKEQEKNLKLINKSFEKQLKEIEDDEKKCIEALKPNVQQTVLQQTGASVTEGRVLASNQGM